MEQFGRVALEAMVCGRPVVTYDCGELPRVVGAGGLIVKEGAVSDLAAAVGRMATEVELRNDLARAAIDSGARYRPEALARELQSFWQGAARR